MVRASALLLAVAAAGSAASEERFPVFPEPHLQIGRALWVANCLTCHGYGIAGAPDPTDSAAWAHRLAKGRETLYRHAIEGFFGPGDTMMPARGGNPDLTDDEVRAAVDYMATLAANATEETQENLK
jgi:cytochrome c5